MAAVAHEIETYVDEKPAASTEIEPDNLFFVVERLKNLQGFSEVRRDAHAVYMEDRPHGTPGRIVKVVFFHHV